MELRGRGSFVDIRRKSLTFNNIFSDSPEEEPSTQQPKHSMKTYLESLLQEKEEWKNILLEKKKKFKDIQQKCQSEPLVISKKDVEKFVSPDDKEFLESKPNYLEIVKSAKNYIDAVNYLRKYKLDIIDYYNKAYNELEINQKLLVDELCGYDLCEICNLKNCQKPEHKFVL